MKYLSCFTGIGGLEGSAPPFAVCEIDENCQAVLKKKYNNAKIIKDVRVVGGFSVDAIVGGWPCQDLSVAGKKQGLKGENSGLFYDFVNAAIKTKSNVLIAENVTNLLKMDNGNVFVEVLNELKSKGFGYISWRVLNARQFGLPHHRRRVFIIASNEKENCFTLFRDIPKLKNIKNKCEADGFYWTAGTQSINYSKGYVPTIKVGSGLAIPSAPAVFYRDVVRQLTSIEALKLQGFNCKDFEEVRNNLLFKMAGNAVAVPVGRFVVDGVAKRLMPNEIEFVQKQSNLFADELGDKQEISNAGFYDGEIHHVNINQQNIILASNLSEYLDLEEETRLSARAASGLLKRLTKSGQKCPEDLRKILEKIGQKYAVIEK